MSKCKDCIFYNGVFQECNKAGNYRSAKDEVCDKFEQIKQCEHRYENCDSNGCSIICHANPSEKGCDFYYECKLDNYQCDEKCDLHKDRHEMKVLREEQNKLFTAETAIKLALTRYSEKMANLREKIEKQESEN